MDKSKTRNNYLLISTYLIIIAVIVGLLFVIINALVGKNEYINSSDISKSVASLSCEAHNLKDSFFDVSGATSTSHEVKVIFRNDKIDTIMYTLKADYDDDEIARVTESHLRAYYDQFMDKNGFEPSAVSNDFSLSDTTVRVKLYTEGKGLNSTTYGLFMLDPSISYSDMVLQNYYEGKGFDCNRKD